MNLIKLKTKIKNAYQYSFTLVELVVVIVVLGILTAIVVPNVSSMKEEAELTALESNERNLQTSVDMYRLDNFGDSPSEYIPVFGVPAPLDFRELYPDYTRNLPETEGYRYWVDYQYRVWYSKADSPSGVLLEVTEREKTLSWSKEAEAVKYGVYKVSNEATSAAKKAKFVFVKEVEGTSTAVSEEGTYAVTSFDDRGFETPPATSEYIGYPEDADYLMPKPTAPPKSGTGGENETDAGGGTIPDNEEPIEGAIPLYTDNQPKVAGDIQWKGLAPEMLDSNATTFSTDFNRQGIAWTGDLTRRTVQFDLWNDYGNGTVITILDAKGKSIPFIDTKNVQMESKRIYNREKFGLVIPAGAKMIKLFETSTAPLKIYEVGVVSDNVLPDPVTDLTLTPGVLKVSLNWKNPSDSDFKNAVIYRNGEVIGTSANGTFVDKPLYANTDYTYEVESVDTSDNRSRKTIGKTKTLVRHAEWSGLTPAGFDFDSTTSSKHSMSELITWKGDLEGRVIHLDMQNPDSNGANIYILDANGNRLQYQNADTGAMLDSIRIYNRTQLNFIMPKGAASLSILETYRDATVFDLHESETDTTRPDPVTGLQIQATEYAAHLSWKNPSNSDFSKVAIFRDNQFVAFAKGTSYTDTPLFTGKDYVYEVRAMDSTGNQSTGVQQQMKTLSRAILWSGLEAGGFDGNPLTSVKHPNRGYITWTGDLAGRTIRVDFENQKVNGGDFYFQDAQGANLPFLNKQTGATVTSIRNYYRQSFDLVVPENAVRILIGEPDLYTSAIVYDIREVD